jgi:signal transduction histidine kinase
MSSTKWNKPLKGIRFRITLVYSTLFGLFLCVFAYFLNNQYFTSSRNDYDSSLINYAIDLSEHLVIDPSGLNIAFKVPDSEIKKAFPFILKETFYSVRDLKGKVLMKSFGTESIKEIPYNPNLPLKQDYTHRFLSFRSKQDVFRAVNLKITNSTGKEMILQVATNHKSILDRERNHSLFTIFIVPVLIIFSSLFSYFISGNALDPIKTLTDSANKIAAQNLSLRVPRVNTGDEVEELAKTLNNLLERLETSFNAQENFVSNASHQLNTPLAIIKGELDVLESKERTNDEIKKFHQSLRQELGRLIELVKNMLLISRVKSGLGQFVFFPVRLDDLLVTTSTRLSPRAREKKITIRFNIEEHLSANELEVLAEKQLLDALFENILDNAIKYSPEESTIEINIKRIAQRIEVWIQDEGPGMEEDRFDQIIKNRFNRGQSNLPGSGIGLFLANKIAGFHQSEIIYKRLKPRGSLLVVRFGKT